MYRPTCMQPCSVLELAALLHVAQIAKIVKMSTYLLTGLFWRGNFPVKYQVYFLGVRK